MERKTSVDSKAIKSFIKRKIAKIEKMERKTIKVSKDFKDWIERKGKKGETYEEILKRLVNYKKRKAKK